VLNQDPTLLVNSGSTQLCGEHHVLAGHCPYRGLGGYDSDDEAVFVGRERLTAVLAGRLAERLAENLEGREVWCGELGAVLGAHVGPGMVAVCLAPLLTQD